MTPEQHAAISQFVQNCLAADEATAQAAEQWPATSIPDGLPPVDETMQRFPKTLRDYYLTVDAESRLHELSALRETAAVFGRMQVDDKYGETATMVIQLLAYRYRRRPGFKPEWTPDGY
jgi:hypothetical protein